MAGMGFIYFNEPHPFFCGDVRVNIPVAIPVLKVEDVVPMLS